MPATAPFAMQDERPFLPLLLLVFICSGVAALIFEVIWQQKVCVKLNGTASLVPPGCLVF
jgi:hypothetical protein